MTKPALKQGLSYRFIWRDTYSHQGWFSDENIAELTVKDLQETVGIFVREIDGWYIVAAHKNSHEGFKMWGIPCWIPKACVSSIRQL